MNGAKRESGKPSRRVRWVLSFILTFVASVFFGAAIYYWLYKGNTWHVGPMKIRLHQWEKPWLFGMAAWLLAVLARPGPFLPARWLSLPFRPWSSVADPARDAGLAWTVFGLSMGAAIGLYLHVTWFYIFPTLAHAAAIIAVCALAGALIHWIWSLVVGRPWGRMLAGADYEYRAGLRTGLYLLVWMALCYGPLRQWEGRFYDPLWPLPVGFMAALALIWILRAPGRARFVPAEYNKFFIGGFIALAILLSAVSYWTDSKRNSPDIPPRDRVIFITMDTTRADHLSCYGYGRATSPNIDAIARSGVRFESAVCPMGITDPSHTSMFTGTYPRTHGVVGLAYPITGEVSSLPEYFRDRGYATAAVISRARLDPANILRLPGFDYQNVPGRTGEESTAPNTFRRAANWLYKNRDKDVFIWVHFFDAHDQYLVHENFKGPRFTKSLKKCKAEAWVGPDNYYSAEEIQHCVDLYDGEIAYMDHYIGKLVSYAEKLEPAAERPPFIVLIADHGEALGEYQYRPLHYGFGHKANLYDAVSHIPLIMSWPGMIQPSRSVGGIVETLDLPRTLVDYVFDARDFKCQGQDLRPVIEGKAQGDNLGYSQRWIPDEVDETRSFLQEQRYSVFKGDFKLMTGTSEGDELYDMDKDPGEDNNLAGKLPDEDEELKMELELWKKDTPETKPGEPVVDEAGRNVLKALGYIQ